MSNINFDPFNNIKMLEFVETLSDKDTILENSVPIFVNPVGNADDKYIKTMLYGDVTVEQMTSELHKLENVIEATLENSVPVSENAQHFMVASRELLTNRIALETDMQYICNNTWLKLYESSKLLESNRVCTILQSEIEDVFINENTEVLNDVITLIENESRDHLCIESIQTLVMVGVENILDVSKVTEAAIKKIYEPLEKISSTSIELAEGITACEKMLENLDKLYIKELGPRFEAYIQIRQHLENTIEEASALLGKDTDVYEVVTTPTMESLIVDSIFNIAVSESDQAIIESLNEFSRYQTMLEMYGDDIILETKRHGGNIRKKTASIARRANKLVNKTAKGAQKSASVVKTSKKKIYDPMEKFIETTFDKIKKADGDSRREIIIKGGVVPKVLRFVRRAIAIGSVGMVSPAIAGISLLTYIALDKSLDAKAKRKVLKELEDELEVVNEKIEDSKGDDNKQNKYQLIRIKQKLESDIVRIRHGLD